jgi:hypothetical protein
MNFPSCWKVSDKVDIEAEDIWCPGEIVSVNEKSVKVTYEGWDESFDEIITKPSRLAKGGTYVTKYKGWVDLFVRLPSWPCVIYDRPPKNNSPRGIEFLKIEKKLFIKPSGTMTSYLKPYHHGVWMNRSNILPFSKHRDAKIAAVHEGNRKDLIPHFDASVKALQENEEALDFEFKFEGTYEVNTGGG